MIKYTLGWLVTFMGVFLAVPLITAAIYWEKAFFAFLLVMLTSLALGILLRLKKPQDTSIYAREGFVIVSASWILLSLFGAIPFMITGVTTNFADALFESASGFTTTGASIFEEVEWLPKSILMWRSFTHWIGGMGVLVFIMAFLPLGGGQNMHIMRAESPGPEVSKLVPRVKKTAIILYIIYFVMTVIMFITLLFSDMSVFDSINTAFATAGTGGFGFKNDSFASATAAQQIIVTVFMLLFSINFNSYYLILKLKLRDAFNSEVRAFLVLVIAVIGVITANLWINLSAEFDSIWEALRHAAFNVASLVSTTGFSSTDFNLWPALSQTLLIIVLMIGGCAGSTAGGIKVSRIVILFKGMARELRTIIHPRQVKKISIDGKPVDREVIRSVNAYITAFIVIFSVSLIAISFEGRDLITSFTSVAATMGNAGPGLNGVGPMSNYGDFSIFSKLIFTFDMLAGRLELFPMLILFAPSTYSKTN